LEQVISASRRSSCPKDPRNWSRAITDRHDTPPGGGCAAWQASFVAASTKSCLGPIAIAEKRADIGDSIHYFAVAYCGNRERRGKDVSSGFGERRLAAILAADVVGYSRMVGIDEPGTLARLRVLRTNVIDPLCAEHGGRVFKTTGDGLLAEFASTVQALRCAVEMQQRLQDGDFRLRVGLHQGDVVVEGDDLLGDGVNVAARLEALAEPGGICISGRVREDAAGKFPFDVEDLGEPELKNIVQRHRVFRVRIGAAERPALALPDKPSLAVLPFANMSGDPEQEYFADGMVEEIITGLSRVRSFFVIARNSSFTYKGRAVDVKQVGRELGVRYVLEGSVRKAGNRVRITGQLVDATSGAHVWAERYDRNLADVFALQAEIAEAVTAAISPAVASAERQRARRKPPGNLNAWEAYQRGLWHLCQVTADDNQAAQEFFRQAIELDPTFAGGYTGLSEALDRAAIVWHTRELAEAQRLAEEYARRAVSLDGNDAYAHVSLASALVMRGDSRGAREEAERALALNPNEPDAYGTLGCSFLYDGEPEKGLVGLEENLRRDPFGLSSSARRIQIAVAHYLRGDYEATVVAARRAIRISPSYSGCYTWLAAALGQLGRIDEASEVLAEAAAAFGPHIHQRPSWLRPEDYEHWLDGLRKAGWQG
jgi:adenylate cyclase